MTCKGRTEDKKAAEEGMKKNLPSDTSEAPGNTNELYKNSFVVIT